VPLALPKSEQSLPAWSPLVFGVPLSLALAGTVWVAHHLESDPTLREVALFAHLASLVVGFGAVLTIDWVGLLWALRLRTLNEVLDTARNVQVPIWVGLMGLVLSGTLLEPDITRQLTQIKLGLVLIVTWNGLVASTLHRRLLSGSPTRLTLGIAGASALISQSGWWGAMAIGFVNH
jgi:hypothetical protein